MNIKEAHVVAGMSRDSSVSRQNPNLVYDAHNIRITTKDGRNSLYAVTNERGTRSVATSGSTIVGTPIGHAIIDKYMVLFTHDEYVQANQDHIYRCEIRENGIVSIFTVFEGNAKFDIEHPIETLPVFEDESIQKVYWVDGINQPRMVNVKVEATITNTNFLEFSPSVALLQTLTITKNSSGGEFPVGTIQYAFSYYKINGQETRLIDVSPMYYLSPKDKGLDATSMSNASFHIIISGADTSFDKIRLYSIVRTQENAVPVCRIVGDFDVQNIRPATPSGVYGIDVIDNGVIGKTIEAASLYFIGGEKLIAGTLAQKDNTLFLGNIKLDTPNLETVKTQVTAHPITPVVQEVGYRSIINRGQTPIKSYEYYGYEPDNNRSSYFIKAFKYMERYKLGFIAQYENGQWSEPLSLNIVTNNIKPAADTTQYKRGGFKATINTYVLDELKSLGFKRLAPVVVYPRAIGRRTIVQGILCPTLSTYGDRESNSPFAQSSWFFRFNTAPTEGTLLYPIWDQKPLEGNHTHQSEIQCMDGYAISSTQYVPIPNTPTYGSKYSNWFFYNTKLSTLHSPDVDCVGAGVENLDLTDTKLIKIGESYLTWDKNATVLDKFLETENIGINTKSSQVVRINRSEIYDNISFTLYADSAVDNEESDEVTIFDGGTYMYGWVVYPWHRSGSLNNQAALTTKQKSEGFTSRTAMLKRNITARASFARTIYNDVPSGNTDYAEISMNSSTPKVYSSDQLSGISLSEQLTVNNNLVNKSYIYYGNIDKVLVPDNGFYYSQFGWVRKVEDDSNPSYTVTQLSEWASKIPSQQQYSQFYPTGWLIQDLNTSGLDYTRNKVTDPVSMKYKSTPHIVVNSSNMNFFNTECGYAFDISTWSYIKKTYRGSLYIVELIRKASTPAEDDIRKFGDGSDTTTDAWIRCGDSVSIPDLGTVELNYLQGDCYFQMYDCLKTYPFTMEDTNSVIEIFSTMLETYVNLDFKYDKNRGSSNNVALGPTNFNLFNNPAYNQSGNFFSYHQLDYNLVRNKNFPNIVTWSLEKHFGEDVDTWTSIDASNTEELDGAFGRVNKLINYNNNIYCFQDIGISQLLFNSRVQIPTSDNTPIEITNGMKMDGKKYISSKIGCTNKWSIVETPLGLYFNDDILKATYMFNGQLTDLSTTKGMKSWMNNSCEKAEWTPKNFENCRAFYDKVGRDVYWVYKDTALVYSEVLGQYMSFMDYGEVPLIESIGNSTYAVLSNHEAKTTAEINTPFKAGAVVINTGKITLTLANNYAKTVLLEVEWRTGGNPRNPQPAASVFTQEFTTYDKVYITINTCSYYNADEYTLGEVLTAMQAELPSYLTAALNVSGENPLAYKDNDMYDNLNTYLTNRNSSPIWELGKGSYNMFFGVHKPYWLTLISNSYPTENKIFNNVAWRDIVTDNGVTEPFNTFDHIRVWTENQDTQSVRFSNSLSQNPSRQPISYDAAISNLRKKFNVWRAQIPRDRIAPNTNRARISNPWCYIKLSREDMHTERHEIMDIEVDYFM